MSTDGRLARGEQRKILILDAAIAVVAESGSGSLTHRAAATRADVSVASVTYHFPSIDDLRLAMFDHAGSRIGMTFRTAVEGLGGRIEGVPELCAIYASELVTSQRIDTVAVFEMIVAAFHDEQLRPLARFFNQRLTDLLEPYVGNRKHAFSAASAVQGIILSALAEGQKESDTTFQDSIIDLIQRYGKPSAS
jgi:DNA-binding transcriptional regulator YbjK